MLPMPTSRVFRSRYGALRWAFWVIVAAVTTVGFAEAPSSSVAGDANASAAANTTDDAMGTPVNDSDVARLVNQLGG